jgi:hypothetical protein
MPREGKDPRANDRKEFEDKVAELKQKRGEAEPETSPQQNHLDSVFDRMMARQALETDKDSK